MLPDSNPPNPFKGLRPYEEADQQKLFGRDRDLILMKDRIFSARTTLLFAGSGVGKTSFLNAKVIPELKKQYSVVWHNRWVGGDRQEASDEELIDDQRIRLWPPRSLFRDLVGKLSFWHDKKPGVISKRQERQKNEDNLSLEVQKAIARSLCRSLDGTPPRLSQVLSRFRKSSRDAANTQEPPSSDKKENDRGILILDQFEEVFQYHAYEDYFNNFVTDLCEIINSDDFQVRVVFSMREEFLGELSIFDNKIPDLFNNYYRLKYPDKDEAKEIIRRTCELVDVSPDETKLTSLVGDWSKIEKGSGSFVGQSRDQVKAKPQVIKRNFVAPPYLQIACAGLWNKQYVAPIVDQVDLPLPNDNKETEQRKPSYPPFLVEYHSGDESDGDEVGGDAQKALREFCQEKLNKPFLTEKEQDIAARAFGFLVTKQGAKMAYELSSLAAHMDERSAPLKETLEKLSVEDARILRESRGPDRSYWFELYHDMYATIVDEWKRGYLKRKKRLDLIRLIPVVALPAILVFLLFAVPHWITKPLQYRNKLIQYQNHLQIYLDSKEINSPISEDEKKLALDANDAYRRLRETMGYGSYARTLWADVLERRALVYQRQGSRDEALLCLLTAASLRFTSSGASADLAKAQLLISDDYAALRNTFCVDCSDANLSSDGKTVLTLSSRQGVKLWDANTGKLRVSLCSDCIRAIFSNDGKAVGTLSTAGPVNVGPPALRDSGGAQRPTDPDSLPSAPNTRAQDQSNPESRSRAASNLKSHNSSPPSTETAYEVKFWDTVSGKAFGKPITIKPSGPIQQVTKAAGSDQKADTEKADTTDSAAPTLAAVAGNESGYLVAVITDKKVVIGQSKSGALLPKSSSLEDSSALTSGDFMFSPDGSYLLVQGMSFSARLWKITEQGPALVNSISHLTGVFAFSPDNRFLLALHDDGKVALWSLHSSEPPQIPSYLRGMRPTKLAFSSDGREFAIIAGTDEPSRREIIQFYDTSSMQPIYRPLTFDTRSSEIAFRSDTKSLLRTRRERNGTFFEKWNLQDRRLDGRIAFDGPAKSAFLNPDDDWVLLLSGNVARSLNMNPVSPHGIVLQGEGKMYLDTLSRDAATLLTLNGDSEMQVWNLETGKPLSGLLDPGLNFRASFLSPDGKYVAIVSDKTVNTTQVRDPTKVNSTEVDSIDSIVDFSPDSQFMAVSAYPLSDSDPNYEIYILRPELTSPLVKLKSYPGLDYKMYSPDNKYLVAKFSDYYVESEKEISDFGRIRLWALPSGTEIFFGEKFTKSVTTIPGANNKMITFSRDESSASLWDMSNGQKLRTFDHDADMDDGTLSPDSKWVVTSDQAGVVRLWDLAEPAHIDEVKLPPGATAFTFSANSQRLLIRKGVWLHRFSIDKKGFHYLGGITPGSNDGLLFVDPNGEKIRLIRQLSESLIDVLNIAFSGDATNPVFEGTPDEILSAWQKKLALGIDDFGRFYPL